MSFLDSVKHAVFTDDETKQPTAPPPAPPSTHPDVVGGVRRSAVWNPPQTGLTPMTSPGQMAPAATGDDNVYQRLFTITDFAHNGVGAILNTFIEPLVTELADERQRFRLALKQAVAQGKLTPEQIPALFDQLLSALENEATSFTQYAASRTESEVNDRQRQIDGKNQQIRQLQQEVQQLTVDMSNSASSIAAANAKFNAAVQRRSAELTQQKAQYVALIQGQ